MGSDLLSASNWIVAGVVLAAKTGRDYRLLTSGDINQAEFDQNLRQNSAGTVGSVLGGIIGFAVGLPVGGYIADGTGAIIGAVVGGVTGSLFAERVMISAERALEEALVKQKKDILNRQSTLICQKSFSCLQNRASVLSNHFGRGKPSLGGSVLSLSGQPLLAKRTQD